MSNRRPFILQQQRLVVIGRAVVTILSFISIEFKAEDVKQEAVHTAAAAAGSHR
jgi:hypothetical protein